MSSRISRRSTISLSIASPHRKGQRASADRRRTPCAEKSPTALHQSKRSLRRVLELLPADARFVHEPALGHGERRHALVISASRCGLVLGGARSGRCAGRACLCVCARRDGDRRCIGAEFEIATGEFPERPLILKKDDFTIGLPAELKADGDLCHGRVSDILSLLVHAALAVGPSDAHAALAYRWEDGIPVCRTE